MKTSVKPILIVLLSLSFVLASPLPGAKANEPEPQDVGLAWVVIRYNFPCPSEGRNRPTAIVTMKWGTHPEQRFEHGCHSRKTSPLHYAKGIVARFNTRNRPPLRELKIQVSNGTYSDPVELAPPEWTDDSYYRVRPIF